MKNTVSQFFLLASFFGLLFLGLLQINWLSMVNIDDQKGNLFEKIGESAIEELKLEKYQYTDDVSLHFLDSLKNRLCLANGMDKDEVKIYLFEDEEVNAFALPGNNIYFNSETLRFAEHPDYIAGVMAHELAHLKKDHVKNGILAKLGINVLFIILTGSDAGAVGDLFTLITSSSYSKFQEKEADQLAVQMLENAKIDPIHYANFMTKLATLEKEEKMNVELFNTHPASKERAKDIIKHRNKNLSYTPSYNPLAFEVVQEGLYTKE